MDIDPTELKQRLDFAVAAAEDAGRLILSYYQDAGLTVELKGDASPVTVADRGAEELLRETISAAFPEDGILGEELEDKPSANGMQWILDPIDGTKSFVHGVPLFGTLIGLECDGRVVAGVCRLPALDEVVYAAVGQGAWWQTGTDDPRSARVSTVSELSEALLCVTTITSWEKIGRQDAFENLLAVAGLARGWGDCYGHILVATGRAEVIVDPQMNAWDAAALVPILQEAGGHFVDWTGKVSIYGGNGLSVNGQLKDAVLELIKPE
jgi:histidinol phosphatase-like enzyme (inositol monophosphatase family)